MPPRDHDRPADGLSIEAIVAIEPPREYRLHPRDRAVAYTAEAAGSRQLFTMPLRGGYPTQLTASEEPVGDPQWSPDGRRLAFVRDDEIWVIEADGSRLVKVTGHKAGTHAPRWSPDGKRLAFVSRRRGWSQVWIIDAPVPRRGRPANEPRAPEERALTPAGVDVTSLAWSPDGTQIAVTAQRRLDDLETAQIVLVDVATGAERTVAGETSFDSLASWLPDGSILFVSDADGWSHVVRLTADGRDRIVLTSGEREHGVHTIEFGRGVGFEPDPSPDGRRFVHIEIHDGLVDLVVRALDGEAPPKRGRGRPPKTPRTLSSATAGQRINPWDGVWRQVGWLADGGWVAAIGESETRPQDLWLLPVPGVAPEDARPAPGDDLTPGDRRCGPGPRSRAADRAHRVHGPRRAPDRRQPVAAFTGDGQARWRARSDHRECPRRAHRPGLPILPATQVPPCPRGIRVPGDGLPRLVGLRA